MARAGTTLREVSLTEARNLSPLFDEAVRHEHPVLIVRNRREWGLLLSRDAMVRMLAPYRFQVHVRLSLARDDAELLELLFPSVPTAEAEPLHKAAG